MTSIASSRALRALCIGILATAEVSQAQTVVDGAPTPQPVVTLRASATGTIADDRMHAYLRAEVDNVDATVAANEVNTRMGRALAKAKSIAGVDASTTGYTTYQVNEPNRPLRWRVTQSLALESADFTALAALVTRLQSQEGMLLSGLDFSVSATARRAEEDALTEKAIKAWQHRAQAAAQSFGAGAWRTGRVSIQTGDSGRPPVMRVTGMATAATAPVAVEGGTTDVTVTVSGEAILDTVRAPR
ncbi:MAG: SIMPL domain-containing protein [Betaproteobacteria bacterium]|nr:SIMPL domain-containing protein [Betaproteobacteria bacterium]MDE2209890.1 SIMPL domain-containing protein [Betaproteobacteria bacterium]MDE2357756.1 SIMPL domain-containing protein [Betaproteobacteria bacterium]